MWKYSATRRTSHRLMETAANVCPPIQSITELALHIGRIAKGHRSKKKHWEEFQTYVQDAIVNVTRSLTAADVSQANTRDKLEKLESTLREIIRKIDAQHCVNRRFERAFWPQRDLEFIADMKSQLDDVIQQFTLDVAATTLVQLEQTRNAVLNNQEMLSQIVHRPSMIASKLRRVIGASWDPDRVCLPNTRTRWIQQILEWIDDPVGVKKSLGKSLDDSSRGAQILLLTGVAGSGKSTVAHSIAQHCHETDCLGSSFFFDREIDGRNNSSVLWNTIAADLASRDPELAERIGSLVERDWSLPSAPISRQFNELVVKSCQGYSSTEPVVLVIDGLDEGWDNALVNALRDGAADLPGNFRIFLTSRMRPELDSLCRSAHVLWMELDIGAQDNIDDIALFVPHQLRKLAFDRNLGRDWPGEETRDRFMLRAGGLFLWVTTVCDYLRSRTSPTQELERLLSTSDLPAGTAEARMDQLYAVILGSFDWTDEGFTTSYQNLMGTALAVKSPLSISVMEQLLGERPLAEDFTLQSLSPLLTGMRKEDHKRVQVRVLHQSLRDFLVLRAADTRLLIRDEEHSQQLGLLCLHNLNNHLNKETPGTGYLSDYTQDQMLGIPPQDNVEISEVLWYACQFWLDHILDMDSPDVVRGDLAEFLEKRFVLWIELTAVLGRCRRLRDIMFWMENNVQLHKLPSIFKDNGDKCLALARRLYRDGRLEEASLMMEERAAFAEVVARRNTILLSEAGDGHMRRSMSELDETGVSNGWANYGSDNEGGGANRLTSPHEDAQQLQRTLRSMPHIQPFYFPGHSL